MTPRVGLPQCIATIHTKPSVAVSRMATQCNLHFLHLGSHLAKRSQILTVASILSLTFRKEGALHKPLPFSGPIPIDSRILTEGEGGASPWIQLLPFQTLAPPPAVHLTPGLCFRFAACASAGPQPASNSVGDAAGSGNVPTRDTDRSVKISAFADEGLCNACSGNTR